MSGKIKAMKPTNHKTLILFTGALLAYTSILIAEWIMYNEINYNAVTACKFTAIGLILMRVYNAVLRWKAWKYLEKINW